jgi:colicin import membrane protein
MWGIIKKHPVAVGAAVLAHILFIGALFFNFDSASSIKGSKTKEIEFISAKTIDEKTLQARKDKKQREANRKKEAARKVKEAKLKAQREKAEKKQREKKKKQKAAEKKRLAELEKKRKADKKKKDELKKQEEIRKQKEEKRKQEEKRKEEEAQAELDLKHKMEADRVARNKAASIKADQEQIYIKRIKGTIVRHWKVPAGASEALVCIVEVRTIPSGDVLDVQVIKKSGDAVFDKSVKNAVFRASPIPVPAAETGLYDTFRVFNLEFKPQNLQ